MADPFRPDTKSQLLREAQVGLSIVAILLVLLVYVAFYRITGRGRHIPSHVQNAPVAQIVWPQNGERIATREIEMTPQQFRDTRMPRPASAVHAGPAIAKPDPAVSSIAKLPVSKFKSSPRSSYQTFPSTAAMAETKTPRPNAKLKKPNFSPDPKGAEKSIIPPVAKDTSKPTPDLPVVTAPKLVQANANHFQDFNAILPKAKSFPSVSRIKAVDTSATVQPPAGPQDNPFLKDWNDSQVDSKVELASLEEDGNDFQVKPPLATEVASSQSDPKSSPVSTSVTTANEFQHVTLDKSPNGSDLSDIAKDPQRTLKTASPSGFAGLENSFNALRPKTSNQFNVEPTLAQEDKRTSAGLLPSSIPSEPSNQFAKPVLDPSHPMVDRDDEPVLVKRLARLPSNSELPAEKKQIKEQFRESKLSKREYVTKAGDNFWSIAQSVYNDGNYFRALYKYNEPKVPNFDSLKPGMIIGTPELEDLVKLWPDLCPGSETQLTEGKTANDGHVESIYVTQSGDTLFDIARQRLGQASRYSEILNLNRNGLGREVSHLTPLDEGLRIVMPR